MIQRYTLPDMAAIWSDEARYSAWLNVELAACRAMAKLGLIPSEAYKVIKEKAGFDPKRIEEIEAEVQHDVIAFLTSVGEFVGPEAVYIHRGMTSSDVLDTATALQLKKTGQLLLDDLRQVRQTLGKMAVQYKDTTMIGRTHGVHAEPITFGLKLASWYSEILRHQQRLEVAVINVAVGKVSGAVGTFAYLDPMIEEDVCRDLGLTPEPVATQIVARDRHAHWLLTLALIGSSLEKFAQEIRHLHRTEVNEVQEGFSSRQKGSSAMPHKRNPIVCERICGMARLLRGYAVTALESVALWHERDISHSSAERVILPDSALALHYMLKKFQGVLQNLVVRPEVMAANLGATRGAMYSQGVLLALIEKGLVREEAYRLVQRLAMQSQETTQEFQGLLKEDEEVRKYLADSELADCFDLEKNLKQVDAIFARLGLTYSEPE
jgi:adenylosuccinate lyase